jgi:hypothetical protein
MCIFICVYMSMYMKYGYGVLREMSPPHGPSGRRGTCMFIYVYLYFYIRIYQSVRNGKVLTEIWYVCIFKCVHVSVHIWNRDIGWSERCCPFLTLYGTSRRRAIYMYTHIYIYIYIYFPSRDESDPSHRSII